MTISRLLLQTANRYASAVRAVLARWQPACGCHRPGTAPQCEACPCLPVFERLVREEIDHVSRDLDSPTQ